MHFVNWVKTNELAVKQVGQFAVYISYGLDFNDERDSRAWNFVLDYLKNTYTEVEYYNYMGSIIDGGLFFFELEEEAWKFYSVFEQPLTDSSGLYAAVYSPVRGCLTENT